LSDSYPTPSVFNTSGLRYRNADAGGIDLNADAQLWSRASLTNLEHHGGAGSQDVEDSSEGNVEAEYGVPVPSRLPPATTLITFIHLYFIVYLCMEAAVSN
jgi:hypothetical protein